MYVGRIKETEAFQLNSVIKALIITLRKSLHVYGTTVLLLYLYPETYGEAQNKSLSTLFALYLTIHAYYYRETEIQPHFMQQYSNTQSHPLITSSPGINITMSKLPMLPISKCVNITILHQNH